MIVSARQLVAQMEDRLGRLDAIMNYILSDPALINDIKVLGMEGEQNIPETYIREAGAELEVGLTTDYIIRNSHRTVFYNQADMLFSSYVQNIHNQRLNEAFSLSDLPYLPQAEAALGKSVIIGAHEDDFGMYDDAKVYSLVKALQGYHMGFLEAENTTESLDALDASDPQTRYLILVNGSELLYNSSPMPEDAELLAAFAEMEDEKPCSIHGWLSARATSELYEVSVMAVRPENTQDGKSAMLLTAISASLVVFAIGFLSVIFWAFIMIRPVEQLRMIMENTNLENLQLGAEENTFKDSPDEFKALAESYKAMTERLDRAIQNERRSSMLTLQAQFDTLQTQVNPHFIYNVLNIISGRGVLDEDLAISQMCGALAEMLRYSTSNKERYALVSQELKYLDNYFFLIKARYEDRFEFSVVMDEKVKDMVIPKMALQQLVENSLAHGFGNTVTVMRIELFGSADDSGWRIAVRDNGQGFSEGKLKELKEKLQETKKKVLNPGSTVEMEIGGMGIENTYARCLLLFAEKLIFELRNTEEGAEVVIGEKTGSDSVPKTDRLGTN